MKTEQKRFQHSIRSKIIATAVCPLIAMSTAVSVLAINGYNDMVIANVIAAILFVGIVQLSFVSNGIVKSVRMAEEYLNQLSEGNLNIEIDKRLHKRDDEIGCMLQSLAVLKRKLKDSMRDIQKNIIYSHMWPIHITHIPLCREAVIVNVADKLCAVEEIFFWSRKKMKLII